MNGKQYLKNQLPVILFNLLGMLAVALFLMAVDHEAEVIFLLFSIWMAVMVFYLLFSYWNRKRHLNRLLAMAEQLKERYLIAEIMERPERADEQVFYQILKMAGKSMLEKIEEAQREQKEYKEYIEQWIHEVKTPITGIKLLCENHRDDFTRNILAELEKLNQFTEQALYYARSEYTEKDYFVREVSLRDIVHGAIADNKYLLRQNQVAVTVEKIENLVYTDDKWVRFILNQLISNAVKYQTERPSICFSSAEREERILLYIEDNGIGIPQKDLPRVFDKGFTGQNGRRIQGATGMGLYLCMRLCDKLGIGLEVFSEGRGTRFEISFPVNDFITGVQS